MPTVTLRFFAAARSAAGTSELVVRRSGEFTIQDAIDAGRADSSDYDPVLARCSLLLNSVTESNRDRLVADGDVIDVLPPFAGG